MGGLADWGKTHTHVHTCVQMQAMCNLAAQHLLPDTDMHAERKKSWHMELPGSM